MPRIRAIKPDFFKSVALSALPVTARMTFAGLWCYCDDEGRAVDDARLVKAEVWPLDDSVSVKKVDSHLDQLAEAWHIHRYEVGGRRYLHVVNWWEHQRINRPTPSRLPGCPTCEGVKEAQTPTPANGTKRKAAIPQSVRREVALRAGGQPGMDKKTSCHYCDEPGIIVWSAKKLNGEPRAWVHFDGLELDHVIPESQGGPTTAENIVLTCVSCNRGKGHRSGTHASLSEEPERLTEQSERLTGGKERKGKEGKGKEKYIQSSSNKTVVGPEPHDDDDSLRIIEMLAAEKLRRRVAEVGPVEDHQAWLAKVRLKVAVDHGEEIDALLGEGLTVAQVAGTLDSGLRHLAPVCEECGGKGWLYDEATNEAVVCGSSVHAKARRSPVGAMKSQSCNSGQEAGK